MNFTLNIFLAPAPVQPGGGVGAALGSFTPWQLIIGLIAIAIGIAIISSAIRGSGSSFSLTLPTVSLSSIAILFGLAMAFFAFFDWTWPGWPIAPGTSILPDWNPPQGVQNGLDSIGRRVSGSPNVRVTGDQEGPERLEQAALDAYPEEMRRIAGGTDMLLNEALVRHAIFGQTTSLVVSGTNKLEIAENRFGIRIDAFDLDVVDGITTTTTLEVQGTITDTIGMAMAEAFAVANRLANEPGPSFDAVGAVAAHVDTMSMYALVAKDLGLITDLPRLMNQARQRVYTAIPKAVVNAESCIEHVIAPITSDLLYAIEKERAKNCSSVLWSMHASESGSNSPNQTRVDELAEAARLHTDRYNTFGPDWVTYQNSVGLPAFTDYDAATDTD